MPYPMVLTPRTGNRHGEGQGVAALSVLNVQIPSKAMSYVKNVNQALNGTYNVIASFENVRNRGIRILLLSFEPRYSNQS